MEDMQKNRLQGHLCSLFTISVWGLTFVSTKVLLRTFTPLEIMIARFGLGFLVLLLVGRGWLKAQKPIHEVLFALAGLTGVTLYFLMENIALTYISASLVGVIVTAAPLFTALCAAAVLREKLSRWFFGGFVCAMAGVALVSLAGVTELHFSPVGALLGGRGAGMGRVFRAGAAAWGAGLPHDPADLPHFRLRTAVFAGAGVYRGFSRRPCAVGRAAASGQFAVPRSGRVRDLLCHLEPRGIAARSGGHQRVYLCTADRDHPVLGCYPA